MKKALLLTALLLTVLALLCACGGGTTESDSGSASVSDSDSESESDSVSASESTSVSDSDSETVPEDKTVDMSGITFADLSVPYDGAAHSIEIEGPLPAGIASVAYSGNGRTDVGSYTVTATFTVEEGYKAVSPMTATLTIQAKTIDMSGITFTDATVDYDGSAHSIEIEGTLPAGIASVSYEGNGRVDAGKYTVVASFTVKVGYAPVSPMSATLTVKAKAIDMSGITFTDATVDYDGAAHSIEIQGTLPAGIASVSYEGNGKTAVGTYTVTASFTVKAGYDPVSPMTATLTVKGKTVDMSGITFRDAAVDYDGTPHSIEISGTLPAGIASVSYEGNGKTKVGSYTVTATFTVKTGYASVAPMTATLTVNKATVDMSGVSFTDAVTVYDGEAHSIEISGVLPKGIKSVSYEGNGKTKVGTYTVTATFTVEEGYKAVAPMTATLTVSKATVDMSGISFSDVTVGYNGKPHSIEISGALPKGIKSVSYMGNGKTAVGTYTVTVTFAVEEGYNAVPSMTAILTVLDKMFVDGAFTYLDEEKTILYKVNSGLVSTSLVIPDQVKSICDFAIFDLPNLVEIYVPSSVKTVGEYAFGFKGSVDNPTPAGITVYGDAGSAAATWCDANGVTFSAENPLGLYVDPSMLYVTDGMTMWLDAFDPETTTVDLVNGKWYDKVGGQLYATFKGGNTWWKMRQTGGVGYDMSKAQWDASYKEVGLIFDSTVLPNSGFTVEVLLDARGPSNADGTRYMDSSARYGIYKPDVSAFDFGGLRCMQFGGSTISSSYMTRWFYHVNPWTNHQRMEWVIKDSTTLQDPAIATMSVTYVDMGNEHVVYNMFYNGTRDFTFDNTTHASMDPEKNTVFSEQGGKKYIPMSEGNFSLLNGFPGTLYSVRIYNRTLTEDEVRINHMADLLSYFKIDLEKYGMLFDSQLVELAKALNGFNMGSKKSEIIAALNEALTPKYSATVTVNYQKPDGTVFQTKTYTAMVGDEYSISAPTLSGHYTRDLYVNGTLKGNTTLTVTYKKIPQGVNSAIIKQLLPGVVCWGDSLTAGAGSGNGEVAAENGLNLTDLNGSGANINYVVTLQNLINQRVASTTVTNCGVGGETSAVIAARAQTKTYYLYLGQDVTLSGSSCKIDIQQYSTTGRLGILRQGEGASINDVTIEGTDSAGKTVTVKGRISAKLAANAPAGAQLPTCDYQYIEYTFTRTDGKFSTVNFAKNARINTKGSYAYDGQWCILYVGTNGGYTDVDELIKQQEEILAACGCTTNYIIISTSAGNATGQKALEEALANKWGDHYFSAREWLSSEEAYRAAGFSDSVIEKYAGDIQAGTVSEILRIDSVHYNSVGYALLGNRIFRQMFELGYFGPVFDYYESLES